MPLSQLTSTAAFDGAPEELDVTVVEQFSQQASAINHAAAALTAKVGRFMISILNLFLTL